MIPQLDVLLRICYFLNLSITDFFEVDKLNLNRIKILEYKTISNKKKEHDNNSKSKLDDELIKECLEQILLANTESPLSIREISNQLGYNRRVLRRKFPELCKSISQKYLKYRKKKALEKINQYCLEVESIAIELHSQGVYPSEINVSQFINKPGYFRYKKVRNTLKKFLDKI